MSGNTGGGLNAHAVVVSNQSMPKQSKALPATVALLAGVSQTLDLSNPIARGIIDSIQCAFIDNRLSAGGLLIASGNTNQGVFIPAGYQAYVPLLTPNPAQFTFTASGGAVNAAVQFLNVPMPFGMWPASGATVAPSATVAPVSASVPAGVSADSVLMAANTARAFLLIQSIGSDLWLNFLGGVASVNGTDCFKLLAGQTYESTSKVSGAAIHYYAVTAGQPICAYQG
jgi:hypothetical protein